MTRLLILPSPFLGAGPYEPLAAELRRRSVTATVAAYRLPPVAEHLVARWAELAADDDTVLVAHSNAGNLAPAVADRAGGRPIVFLDAALPTGEGTITLAPPALRAELGRLADADGVLPRWTRWWPREELADVLPGAWFTRLDRQLPRVPLSYVDGRVPVPDGWAGRACSYLAFGPETYAAELGRAQRQGWPTWVLSGRHLQCVLDPGTTAGAVLRAAASG